MSKVNRTEFEKEVIKLIEDLSENTKTDMMQDYLSNETKEEFENLGIKIEMVQHYGGESQGETYYAIYSFQRGDDYAYVKFDGWYASYQGSEFTEAFLVHPQQKLVTVYK